MSNEFTRTTSNATSIAYTNDDFNQKPPLKGGFNQHSLDSKMDPVIGCPDWTVVITSRATPLVLESNTPSYTSESTTIYHVHKKVLAEGSRKSLYFTRLFENSEFVENGSRASYLTFDHLVAAAFPTMLERNLISMKVMRRPCTTLVNTLVINGFGWTRSSSGSPT
jgi:hypothetical protein